MKTNREGFMHRDFLKIPLFCLLLLTFTGGVWTSPADAALIESDLLAPAPSLSTGTLPPVHADGTRVATSAPPAAVTSAPPAAVTSAPPAAIVLPPVVAPDFAEREEPFFDTSDWPLWAESAWEDTSDVVHDHLRVGLRYRQVHPIDGKRQPENSFLGSITELKPLSDYDPVTWLTFDWLVNPYIGLRFNMEQVRSETVTSTTDKHTDGDVDLSGPALTVLLRLPNRTRFTPSVGLGYAWLTSTFEHNPIWYNGFNLAAEASGESTAYADWVAAGKPPWPNHGYRREIILDDTTALLLLGALEFRITDHLDFTLFIQEMEVQEVDVTFNLSHGGQVFESTHAQFPMSNIGYGAGLRWTF